MLDVVKCHFIYYKSSLCQFCSKLKFFGRFIYIMNKSFVRCYMFQLLVSNVLSFTPSIVCQVC